MGKNLEREMESGLIRAYGESHKCYGLRPSFLVIAWSTVDVPQKDSRGPGNLFGPLSSCHLAREHVTEYVHCSLRIL